MFFNGADSATSEQVVSLLSKMAKKHDGFRAFVYFLDGNPAQLKKMNKKLKADNIALALIPDADKKKTLELYKVNPKAKSTVFVYLNREISEKWVNYNPKKDAKALKNAISAVSKKS